MPTKPAPKRPNLDRSVFFRAPSELMERVEQIAREDRRSVAAVIRLAVERYIDDWRAQKSS